MAICRAFSTFETECKKINNNLNISNIKVFKTYGCLLGRKKSRGGIIPYLIKDNKIYFCFGIDKSSRNITDFAGVGKENETIKECCIREYKQESGSCCGFDINSERDFYLRTASYFVILMPSVYNMEESKNIFDKYKSNLDDSKIEVDDIRWLCKDELEKYLRNEKSYQDTMYIVPRIILSNGLNKWLEYSNVLE